MLPCHCYVLPDREEPSFRKAHKEVLSTLEEDRSKSTIIDLLYKELKENKNNIAKEFLAFVSKECNPQRKVRFAEVSYAINPRTDERTPFNTFSKRLIVEPIEPNTPIKPKSMESPKDDSIRDAGQTNGVDRSEGANSGEDEDSDYSWEL